MYHELMSSQKLGGLDAAGACPSRIKSTTTTLLPTTRTSIDTLHLLKAAVVAANATAHAARVASAAAAAAASTAEAAAATAASAAEVSNLASELIDTPPIAHKPRDENPADSGSCSAVSTVMDTSSHHASVDIHSSSGSDTYPFFRVDTNAISEPSLHVDAVKPIECVVGAGDAM